MGEIMNKRQKRTPIFLPHDIVENILPRLPVKSLLRFKGVCKQWKATISHPKFQETHLLHSKNSSFSFLVMNKDGRLRLVSFENNKFRLLSSIIGHPVLRSPRSKILCHCDGLYLLSVHDNNYPKQNEYVLWNPSTRTRKDLCCPHLPDLKPELRFGICYDPSVKDYKVVILDMKHYAVFYCRNNSWSEMKEMNVLGGEYYFPHSHSVSLKGSICWVSSSRMGTPEELVTVCFDGQDDMFKILSKPDAKARYPLLVSSGDGLYMFPFHKDDFVTLKNEFRHMEKVGGDEEWTEVKVHLSFPCKRVIPRGSIHGKHVIILEAWNGSCARNYLLYDVSKRSCTQITNTLESDTWLSRLFPYVENMFLL